MSSGGVIMVPLVACALLAAYIIVERVLFFRKIFRVDAGFMDALRGHIEGRDFAAAKTCCDKNGSPLARVARKVLESRAMSESSIKELASGELASVLPLMEKNISLLGALAQVSTLLGLLGTVIGNISAFKVLGNAGALAPNPAALVGAIAQALVTTAVGLIIAIPATICHNYLVMKANRLISDMEGAASALIYAVTRGL
jgi:biopolymer transport protein ExbB